MARTGENIFQRKDGRFEGRYIKSRDENGKAVYAYVYGKSREEVREKVREGRRSAGISGGPWDGKTFRDAAERWLEAKKETVAETTYGCYRRALANTVYPDYGDMPLSRISDAEVEHYEETILERAMAEGRRPTQSMIRLSAGIMAQVLAFVKEEKGEKVFSKTNPEKESYKSLTPREIARICRCAKEYEVSEMLAVMLCLFCGLRIGEVCALHWDDVDLGKREIYVHNTAQRIGLSESSTQKTELRIMEIPRKTQIRKAEIPEELVLYIGGFYKKGTYVLSGLREKATDSRQLMRRTERIFQDSQIKGINYQRLRKTYAEGKADLGVLQDVFQGKKALKPYKGAFDREWLVAEMSVDLAPLRILVGLSAKEMGEILEISEKQYRSLETGSRRLAWEEFLTLLFMFHYNERTCSVVDSLGLYPDSLREKLKIEGNYSGSSSHYAAS